MSGGHFDYSQYHISTIAETVKSIIEKNEDDSVNEWGEKRGYFFTKETIEEFKAAVEILEKAYVYAQRIDWLISGDDGEDTFHKRLAEDLERLQQK